MRLCESHSPRALSGDFVVVLPRSPHLRKPPVAAQVLTLATAEQIQLTDIKIVPAPAGDAIYLDAIVHNTGNSAITGAQVNAQFLNKTGRELGTETSAVQGMQGRGTTTPGPGGIADQTK